MTENTISPMSMDSYFWGKQPGFLKDEDGATQNVLTNRLRYKYLKRPNDLIIKKNVQNELGDDPELESIDITVLVTNGVVKLIGSVAGYWDMMIAEDDAYKVRGVFDVKNELVIS